MSKTFNVTRRKTLPDSASKTDFHDLIDGATTGAQVTITGLTTSELAANAGIVDTQLAQITTANKVATSAITDGALNVAAITCDSVSVAANGGVHLTEGTAPSTAASAGALYTKDTGGQPELFFREESDGDEVQITSGGVVKGITTTKQVVGTTDISTGGTSYADMTDMSLTLTGAGTYIFNFNAPIELPNDGSSTVSLALDINGTDVVERVYGGHSITDENPVGKISTSINWIATITTETTAKIQWKHSVAASTQYGTESKRVFNFIKIA